VYFELLSNMKLYSSCITLGPYCVFFHTKNPETVKAHILNKISNLATILKNKMAAIHLCTTGKSKCASLQHIKHQNRIETTKVSFV